MCTWYSRSWIQSSYRYYRWPSFKCECVYTAARNIRWWQQTFIKHHRYADFTTKTYLFFDVICLFKNIRNNMLNQKKFVFPSFRFVSWLNPCSRQLHIMTHISWSAWKRQKSSGLSKKTPKITYQVTHPSNNKQSVPLTLAIFQESTTAAIKSYFPNRLDAANFLTLFYKVFVICNFEQCFSTSNQLGNTAIRGDYKPGFLLLVADWVETWLECPSFSLTKQTSHALMTTLRYIYLFIHLFILSLKLKNLQNLPYTIKKKKK